jgi:hypothetical protein
MTDESAGSGRASRTSQFFDWMFDRVLPTALTVLLCGGALGGVIQLFDIDKDSTAYNWTGGIGGVAMLVAGFVTWSVTDQSGAREDASRQRVRVAERDFEEALRARQVLPQVDLGERRGPQVGLPERAEPLQGSAAGDLALPELWTVTHTRLDHYHEIALRQARQSFRNAQVAMALGFSLLVAFVLVALNASTTAGAVVVGGLGAVSAALAGYVSRTFVLSQQAAASHLRAYFDQPLEFARYLAAERIVMDAGLDQAQRAEVLTALVQSIVASPQEAASDQGRSGAGA